MLIIALCFMLLLLFAVCTVMYLLLTETLDALRDAERQVSVAETLLHIEGPEHVYWPTPSNGQQQLRLIRGGNE